MGAGQGLSQAHFDLLSLNGKWAWQLAFTLWSTKLPATFGLVPLAWCHYDNGPGLCVVMHQPSSLVTQRAVACNPRGQNWARWTRWSEATSCAWHLARSRFKSWSQGRKEEEREKSRNISSAACTDNWCVGLYSLDVCEHFQSSHCSQQVKHLKLSCPELDHHTVSSMVWCGWRLLSESQAKPSQVIFHWRPVDWRVDLDQHQAKYEVHDCVYPDAQSSWCTIYIKCVKFGSLCPSFSGYFQISRHL